MVRHSREELLKIAFRLSFASLRAREAEAGVLNFGAGACKAHRSPQQPAEGARPPVLAAATLGTARSGAPVVLAPANKEFLFFFRGGLF